MNWGGLALAILFGGSIWALIVWMMISYPIYH